jgi:hypothetical protein
MQVPAFYSARFVPAIGRESVTGAMRGRILFRLSQLLNLSLRRYIESLSPTKRRGVGVGDAGDTGGRFLQRAPRFARNSSIYPVAVRLPLLSAWLTMLPMLYVDVLARSQPSVHRDQQ